MHYFMKYILLIFVFSPILNLARAQDQSEKNQIDSFMARFSKKMDTVSWLSEYDNIAWWTSDSVSATSKEEQAKLGPEWFCFKRENIWHAVYGKFYNGQYQMVYHYVVDTNNGVRRINSVIDTFITL